ncbi:MAG: hypothetical protein GX649_19250, partial [Chloroflexi bacterium]|nr:hypothetical protein [Chloroflexota bacterium]
GRLCQLHVSAAGALEIVRQVGGKGFMFTVGDRMTADEAEEYLALLAREDRGAARR